MKTYNNITLIFIIEKDTHLLEDEAYYKTLCASFNQTIPVIKDGFDYSELEYYDVGEPIFYEHFEDKVTVMNRAAERAKTPWILTLEGDENISLEDLPNISTYQATHCFTARVESTGDTSTGTARGREHQVNYQIRLIPNAGPNITHFDGSRIFDISRIYTREEWELAEYVLSIQKNSGLFKAEDVEAEATSEHAYFMQDYWKGIWHLENGKFNTAERVFRYILAEKKPVLQWYELSAYNNLMIALYEQQLFEESAQTAEESLQKNRQQYSPYIILHKINELSGNFEKSYNYLKSYLNVKATQSTKATMDLTLPVEECHFLMAEISHKMGKYKRALTHYEKFHDLNRGQVSISVMERLFLYSVELGDYNKSVTYFYTIFGQSLSKTNQFTNDELESVLQALSLFMDNGWYDFVSDTYEQLVILHPENNQLLNKWVTSLIKNNEFEKAQAVLNKRAG